MYIFIGLFAQNKRESDNDHFNRHRKTKHQNNKITVLHRRMQCPHQSVAVEGGVDAAKEEPAWP